MDNIEAPFIPPTPPQPVRQPAAPPPPQTQAPTPPQPPQPQRHVPAPPPVRHPEHEGIKSVLSTLAILFLAPVIAVILTMFVFQSYEVDGPSMERTLQDRDRLIVLKLPRTFANVTGRNYVPRRGDIIIFDRHGMAGLGAGDKQLIKRVVGLPGERVLIENGDVTIYNSQNPQGFLPDKTMGYGANLPSASGLSDASTRDVDITVPQGEVFVLGDNRNNSSDSRSFGTVPSKDIVGKLVLRIYPFNKAQVF